MFDDVQTHGNDILHDIDSTLHQNYAPSEKIEARDYTNGIPVARDVVTNEVIRIPVTGTTRIGIYAKSGQGKTVLGKAFLSRCLQQDYPVFCGSDMKNDMQSVKRKGGVSKKLREETQGLLRGEEPASFDRQLGIPTFMVDDYRSPPYSYATTFSLGFQDITIDDFKYVIGYSDLSTTQRDTLDEVLFDVELHEVTWSWLLDALPTDRSGKAVKRRLRNVEKKKIISGAGNTLESFLDFDKARLCSLGLKHWRNYRRGNMQHIRFYSALAHKRFTQLLENGEVDGPAVIFDDEFHAIAPADEESPVKDEFQTILDISGRQADVATVTSAQRPEQIPSSEDKSPEDFLSILTDVFLGRGLSWKAAKQVFSVFDFYNPHKTGSLRSAYKSLEQHQFMYMNEHMKQPSDIHVVESLAPLCSHPG